MTASFAFAIRLSNSDREAICKLVLKHRFEQEYLTLALRRQSLAFALYNSMYSEELQKQMKKLPKGWLPDEDGLRFDFGSRSDVMKFYPDLGNSSPYPRPWDRFLGDAPGLGTTRLVPYRDRDRTLKAFGARDPFSIERDTIVNEIVKLNETMMGARVQVRTALLQANTARKLIELWPEIEPFVRSALSGLPPASLPAVRTDLLNDMLKLPAEKEEA